MDHRRTGRRLTDSSIKNLKPRARSYDITDPATPGLQLRVHPSGLKTWYYRYSRPDGKRDRLRLGYYPAMSLAIARRRTLSALEEKQRTGLPLIKASAPTVREVLEEWRDYYLRDHRKRWEDAWRPLERDVLPAWGERKASSITRRDAALLLDEIRARAPIVANRIAASLKQAWGFALDRGLLNDNPLAGMRNPSRERKRDRVLTLDELAQIWQSAADVMSEPLARAFQFLILTGQRRGEVVGLHADEVSDGIWTIPPHRSKNGKQHKVPLSELAMQFVPRRGYAFPGPKGEPMDPDAVSRAAQRLRAELRLPHWTTHDIRRSVASGMAGLGISREVILLVLNHTDPGVTARYDRHRRAKEVQDALRRWSNVVDQALNKNSMPTNAWDVPTRRAAGA